MMFVVLEENENPLDEFVFWVLGKEGRAKKREAQGVDPPEKRERKREKSRSDQIRALWSGKWKRKLKRDFHYFCLDVQHPAP